MDKPWNPVWRQNSFATHTEAVHISLFPWRGSLSENLQFIILLPVELKDSLFPKVKKNTNNMFSTTRVHVLN